MRNSASALFFDINSIGDDYLTDPYPTLAALREYDPVHQNLDGSYFLTRYADLLAVYKDPTVSSDKKVEFRPKFGDSARFEHHTTSLVFNDPPIHARVRKLVTGAFTPRSIAALKPRIETVVKELLDRAEDAGELDVIEDFGIIVPTEVIGDMLGVPHNKRHLLRGWSMKILGALDPITPPEVLDAGNRAVEEFCEFLGELISARRKRPDAGAQGEVLAALGTAKRGGLALNCGHASTDDGYQG